jgi:hypothetical protein
VFSFVFSFVGDKTGYPLFLFLFLLPLGAVFDKSKNKKLKKPGFVFVFVVHRDGLRDLKRDHEEHFVRKRRRVVVSQIDDVSDK